MNLFLIIAILLIQKPTVTEQLKKCWGNYVQGYCRKICKVTEMREVLCANGRYCCLNIKKLEERKKITKPPRPKPPPFALTLPQDGEAAETFSTPRNITHRSITSFPSFISRSHTPRW
ncbi:beta-defensin 127 [Octodon degus]|uniref:Beta-defensin n=1 Tax=Octodon degus TaxID=10160 RepID=A0A6P6EDX8_OCTDE|nr:beta-defensin 127 [Octodon degus]